MDQAPNLPRTKCTDCGKIIKKGEWRSVSYFMPPALVNDPDDKWNKQCLCSKCHGSFCNALCN